MAWTPYHQSSWCCSMCGLLIITQGCFKVKETTVNNGITLLLSWYTNDSQIPGHNVDNHSHWTGFLIQSNEFSFLLKFFFQVDLWQKCCTYRALNFLICGHPSVEWFGRLCFMFTIRGVIVWSHFCRAFTFASTCFGHVERIPQCNDVTGTCKTFAVADWSAGEGVAGIQGSQRVHKDRGRYEEKICPSWHSGIISHIRYFMSARGVIFGQILIALAFTRKTNGGSQSYYFHLSSTWIWWPLILPPDLRVLVGP